MTAICSNEEQLADDGGPAEKKRKVGDPGEFINWAGKGNAHMILPDLSEEDDESSENESHGGGPALGGRLVYILDSIFVGLDGIYSKVFGVFLWISVDCRI